MAEMAENPEVKEVESLTVSEFLETKVDQEVVETLEKNKISGSIFLLMSDQQLSSLVPAIGDLISLQQLQPACRKTPPTCVTPVNYPKVSL